MSFCGDVFLVIDFFLRDLGIYDILDIEKGNQCVWLTLNKNNLPFYKGGRHYCGIMAANLFFP